MTDEVKNEIRQLSRIQRRVIGVLMEKAFTTPEQYPLTLKAVTTGCNQKNNRDPLTEYSEDQVADTLEQLRQLGLVAEVFTDGGRAARYRHYMRHKFDFTETQFAVIAELLLRGRQQPGELRTRASRMVKIESQDQLKADLQLLQEKGFVQSNGSLERRGVEVDHTFYSPKEGQSLQPLAEVATVAETAVPAAAAVSRGTADASRAAVAPAVSAASSSSASAAGTQQAMTALTDRVQELTQQVADLQTELTALQHRLQRLERELGV